MAHVVASVFTVAPVVASLFRRVAARRLMLCAVGHRTNDRLSVYQSVSPASHRTCVYTCIRPSCCSPARDNMLALVSTPVLSQAYSRILLCAYIIFIFIHRAGNININNNNNRKLNNKHLIKCYSLLQKWQKPFTV